MLDIKFIRENKDIVQGGAKQKHVEIDIEKLTAVDDERLKILKEVEELRGEINKVSNNIARDQNPELKLQLIEEMRVVKEDLKTKEEKLKTNMDDFERGVKVHGFRGYFLKQDGAELSWAIWNYARDFFGAKNFIPFIAPAVVHKQHLYGTGHLPGGAEDIYQTQDGDYLSGTAEIPLMGYQ